MSEPIIVTCRECGWKQADTGRHELCEECGASMVSYSYRKDEGLYPHEDSPGPDSKRPTTQPDERGE